MENTQNKKFIFGIIGLALAALAFVFFWFPYFGLILSVAALVLSIIGIGASRLKGFGIAGTIIAPIALVLSLLFTFVITAAFVSGGSSSKAEKKAESVYTAAKTVLMEAAASGDEVFEGITLSNDGGKTYYITVTDLVNLHEIEENPFKSTSSDGGMTVRFNAETASYTATVSGTIDGYRIVYYGDFLGFSAYKN